ncbi:MAG: cupin domain-containing protein [bacterium]
MSNTPALLVTKDAVKRDSALQTGSRGARKLLVTDLYAAKERESTSVEWLPPTEGEKCPVQVMVDAEVAVFNQRATQDRHYHKRGTEIYMVLEGTMVINVGEHDYLVSHGDMIVVNPNAIHEVKPEETEFLCCVVTLNCGGASDKFVVT